MEPLKAGDWVTVSGPAGKFVEQISAINSETYTLSKTSICYKSQATLWIPEPGEWCWFYNLTTDVPTLSKLIEITSLFCREPTYLIKTPSCISETSYNYSRTMSFKHCEPFIGELPSNIKDL